MYKPLLKILLLLYGFSLIFVIVFANIYMEPHTKDGIWIVYFAFSSVPILWAFYITNTFINKTVEKKQRIIWIFLLFTGHIVVFPFYWYHHIWREKEDDTNNTDDHMVMDLRNDNLWPQVKTHKLLLLFCSILPILLVINAITVSIFVDNILAVIILSSLFLLLYLSLVTFYINNSLKNHLVKRNLSKLWIALFLSTGIFTFIIYWYLYIWRVR